MTTKLRRYTCWLLGHDYEDVTIDDIDGTRYLSFCRHCGWPWLARDLEYGLWPRIKRLFGK